jgi:hypothetical protein
MLIGLAGGKTGEVQLVLVNAAAGGRLRTTLAATLMHRLPIGADALRGLLQC